MPPSTAPFRRHFVGWERPWLPQAAAWLAQRGGHAATLRLPQRPIAARIMAAITIATSV
jgi:hypothetical protein